MRCSGYDIYPDTASTTGETSVDVSPPTSSPSPTSQRNHGTSNPSSAGGTRLSGRTSKAELGRGLRRRSRERGWKWRQHAADKRLLREQKIALAVAALCSLSLGPPVHKSTTVSKLAVEELDIGHAFKERQARKQRSWSRLNVSELSGPILNENNPDARCLCWMLLVLVPPGMESQTNSFVSKWLLRKLMGYGIGYIGLVVSSAGLSIWTEWISFPNACCLSVVRASDQQVIDNDIANSTSCIVFVVSESISWEMQKERGDTYNEGYEYASKYIINRLGLNGLNRGKIGSSLVIFLIENYIEDHANGFFDDNKLREGLKWLVSSLPVQPDVTLLLNTHVAPGVGPGDCISVFNNAVNQLAEEILAATNANCSQWPAPEIDLLERTSNERIYAEMFLPSIGCCKIPEFSYDLSWLNHGSHMGKQIQDQKKLLEECLPRYLTESARLLDESQVVTEVNVMVQNCVGLELRDSSYYLAPRWVAIFRRIYNWRLAKLSTGKFSEAYVLTQHLSDAVDHIMMPAVSTDITLDEIIEISCDLDVVDAQPVTLPPRLPVHVHEEPQALADNNGVHG
ncbi:hypothetical protein ACJX0J_013193, partial [Zea mays]